MHKVGLIQVVQKQCIKFEDNFVKSFANVLRKFQQWMNDGINLFECYMCFFWFCTFSVLFLRKNKPIENLDFGFGLYLKECTKVDYII